MTTVSAGASGSYTFAANEQATISPTQGEACEVEVRRAGVLIAGRRVTTELSIGPFDAGDVMQLTAQRGAVDYTISAYAGSHTDTLDSAELTALQALVSEDWMPQRETVMPDEVVRLAATGGVCGAPCYVSRIRCVTGTAVALTVYEGAASTATTLLTATLSAGEEATIPGGRLRAINGVRAVFASGSFDFSIGTEG
jgi:hypothetical protein